MLTCCDLVESFIRILEFADIRMVFCFFLLAKFLDLCVCRESREFPFLKTIGFSCLYSERILTIEEMSDCQK